MHGLQFIVYDAQRGNGEDEEEEKLLAWFPEEKPLTELVGLVGLLQGLRLFCSRFSGEQEWLSSTTDRSTWLSYEPERGICLALTVPTLLLPRHSTDINLRGLLLHAHLVICLLHGSLENATHGRPSSQCQETLGPVLRALHSQLANPAPWLSRELRNPLAAFEAPSIVRIPPQTALSATRVCAAASQAAGTIPPLGPLLLLDHRILWSGLPAADTAAVHAVLQLGAVAAPPTTAPIPAPASSTRATNRTPGGPGAPSMSVDAPSVPDAQTPRALPPALSWQQVALSTGAGLDAEPRVWVWREAAPLAGAPPPPPTASHSATAPVRGLPRAWFADRSGVRRRTSLVLLIFGRLLLVVPLAEPATALDIASLHAHVLADIEALQRMVQGDSRLEPGTSGHVPGYRYMFRAGGRALSTPRVKISAMSHHTRSVAVAMLGSLPPEVLLHPRDDDESLAPPGPDGSENAYPTTIIARSAQGYWASAILDDRSRLLAIRERRGYAGLAEAASSLATLRQQLPQLLG